MSEKMSLRVVVPNLFGIRGWPHGRQFLRGWAVRGEWFCFHLLLTSCYVAQFLTGHGQITGLWPRGWGPLP